MKRTTKQRLSRNYLKIAVVAALASVMLAACASLIPDQEATDPFGLNSLRVPIPFKGPDLRLSPAAVDGSAEAEFEIADFDQALPLNPTMIDNELAIAGASLDDPAGPEQLTLSDFVVNLRVWEGSAGFANATRKATATLASSATVVLDRGACSASCAYTVKSGSGLGDLTLTGGELAAFLDIMTSGTPTNNAAVSISVVGNPDELAGHVLTITLDAENGRISFK